MITYIISSYIIMFLWMMFDVLNGHDSTVKDFIKCWVTAPLALPWVILIKFLNW